MKASEIAYLCILYIPRERTYPREGRGAGSLVVYTSVMLRLPNPQDIFCKLRIKYSKFTLYKTLRHCKVFKKENECHVLKRLKTIRYREKEDVCFNSSEYISIATVA